jgi:hypothetical protein
MSCQVDALRLAEHYHRGGRFAEAQAMCLRILEAQPSEPKALHILGLISCFVQQAMMRSI